MPELTASYTGAISESWTARPYLSLGLRQSLSSRDVGVSSRFAQDTTNVDSTTAITSLGQSNFVGELGIEFSNAAGIRFGASYLTNETDERNRSGGQAYVSFEF